MTDVTCPYVGDFGFLSIFTFVFLTIYYLVIKFKLIKTYSNPEPVGAELAEDTTNYFVSLFILAHSIGCVLF